MSFTDLLSKLFGDKSSRDRKALQPIVDKINSLRPELEKLSNDELRHKIDEVRAIIDQATSADQQAIDELRAKVETLPFDERQPLWDEIDQHEKKILDILDEQLDANLPVVFATMRETAARFANNEIVEVTATPRPRRTRT
jgi:preprotein translocase subunit SecA